MSVILDDLPVLDWNDFDATAALTKEAVRALAADRSELRALVYGIENDPALLAMCEHHTLIDKLIVYDAPERNFRLRVHLSTNDHFDRPHDHRFSFTSFILTGRYRHIWHHSDYDFEQHAEARDAQDVHSAVETDGRVEPFLVTDEKAGACYTLHHSAIHTTVTTDDTVSLFLRGPSEKDRSIITERETGRLWWRYGEKDESPERRRAKRISMSEYIGLRTKLERLELL